MAKQTIVTCDWHMKIVPATTSYELSNGKPGRHPRLDLCKDHEHELLKIFVRRSTTDPDVKRELKLEADRERHRIRRQGMERKPARGGTYWADLEHKVMAAANVVKTNIHINDILKGAGITRTSAGNTLRRLVTKGLLVTTGGRGRYRRYHLPAQ